MDLKHIDSLTIPELATKAEHKIEVIINLLDAILNKAEPQNSDAADDIVRIDMLCEGITEEYDKAKSALNELQQG